MKESIYNSHWVPWVSANQVHQDSKFRIMQTAFAAPYKLRHLHYITHANPLLTVTAEQTVPFTV